MGDQAATVARILHTAMLVAVVAIVAIFRSVAGEAPAVAEGARPLLRFVGLGALAAAGLVIRGLRARLPFIGPETDVAHWWSLHLAPIVTIWAIAEAVGVLGSALWFVTRDTVLLVVLVGASIALLLRLGPGRWVAEQDTARQR